jgi:hypothetical protein
MHNFHEATLFYFHQLFFNFIECNKHVETFWFYIHANIPNMSR